MSLEITINLDTVIGEEENRVLRRVLEGESEEDLNNSLSRVGSAAINEYLEMILGKQLPTRANEIWERRLLHLLKHYYIGRIPSETEISSIFQITNSTSRSLLRNVRTKFRFDLEDEINNTIQLTLQSAHQQGDGSYRVVINSDNVLEELKHMVSIVAIELDQIQRVKNSAGLHSIPEDTFLRLCDAYHVNRGTDEAAIAED